MCFDMKKNKMKTNVCVRGSAVLCFNVECREIENGWNLIAYTRIFNSVSLPWLGIFKYLIQ